MEYTSLPESYVDGRKVSNRTLADNGWLDVTTSVNTGLNEKYVLGRKTEGSVSYNIWTAAPLDAADEAALDVYRASDFALDRNKDDKKDQAKDQRDNLLSTAIYGALEYPEDWSSLETARVSLTAEYAYINGKGLSQSLATRKQQLEDLLEWTNVVAAELRQIKTDIDAAIDQAAIDAVNITFTPAP